MVLEEAKCKTEMETMTEEVEMEQSGRSPSKQNGRVDGEQTVCDHCTTWGFDCQVSWFQVSL